MVASRYKHILVEWPTLGILRFECPTYCPRSPIIGQSSKQMEKLMVDNLYQVPKGMLPRVDVATHIVQKIQHPIVHGEPHNLVTDILLGLMARIQFLHV